jgi:hypothetical protein
MEPDEGIFCRGWRDNRVGLSASCRSPLMGIVLSDWSCRDERMRRMESFALPYEGLVLLVSSFRVN